MPALDASAIDPILARLDGIVRDSMHDGSRLGYFAALYQRVTQRVKEGIVAGEFEDGQRMARLDVVFATRYLDALDAYRRGEVPSRAWLLAFESAARSDLPPLLHLVLGMSAHIGLDLGVAAARVCPGPSLASLRVDFDHINGVLASLVATVERQSEAIAPRLSSLVAAAGGVGERVVDGLLAGSRASAWTLAATLAPLDVTQQVAAIARRDDEVVTLGRTLLLSSAALRLIEGQVVGDVPAQIGVLAEGEDLSRARPSVA